jgi:acyl transferase domain-containing protein
MLLLLLPLLPIVLSQQGPHMHLVHAEEIKRAKDLEAKKRRKAERKAQSVGLAVEAAAPSKQEVAPAKKTVEQSTPIAFVFPGQGSQAVGMLQVSPVAHF